MPHRLPVHAAVCELPLAPDGGSADATVSVDDAGNIIDAAALPDSSVAVDASVMPNAAPARCGETSAVV